ncbi:MAG: glycosyltransferase [Gemmatimonadaceae bacterium]
MTVAAHPELPDVGVLALVPDQWSPQWQPRHHVMSRLARYFHVVWLNPASHWRDTVRQLAHGRLRRPDQDGPETPRTGGFQPYDSPRWLPTLHRQGWLSRTLQVQRVRAARGRLAALGCRKTILYLWRPEFEPALSAAPFDVSCYHIDDEYSFSDVDLPIAEREARVIMAVDQVIVHSKALLAKKGFLNRHTALVPNGVDYNAYTMPRPEPVDLAAVPHPRIGYTGKIKKQLNWVLLRELTQRHPEWHFVFVGPLSPHPEIVDMLSQLATRPNVHFLGAKTVHELTAYPQYFDVCLMPYAQTGYTRYIYPLKLHEYLASGQPVVGSRVTALEDFASVVALATSVNDWSAAIRSALEPAANAAARRTARRAVARQHDWGVLVARIATLLGERLGPGYSSRMAAAIEGLTATPSRAPEREGSAQPRLGRLRGYEPTVDLGSPAVDG